MRKSVAAIFAPLCLLGSASNVVAVSSNIYPTTQSHAYGVASHWTLSWGSYSPYEVLFHYGDGYALYWASTTRTGSSQSYTFWPCVTHTYHQMLQVWDGHDSYAVDNSYATEHSGGPC